MTIKLLTIADYDKVYSLWHNTAGMGMRSLDDSKEGIKRFINRNPDTSFIAEVDGNICGTILCGHDGRRGYIYHTAVAETSRGLGIGKALVENVLNALGKEGIHKAALVVYKNNDLGNGFWEKMGFIIRDDLNYRNYTINIDNEI